MATVNPASDALAVYIPTATVRAIADAVEAQRRARNEWRPLARMLLGDASPNVEALRQLVEKYDLSEPDLIEVAREIAAQRRANYRHLVAHTDAIAVYGPGGRDNPVMPFKSLLGTHNGGRLEAIDFRPLPGQPAEELAELVEAANDAPGWAVEPDRRAEFLAQLADAGLPGHWAEHVVNHSSAALIRAALVWAASPARRNELSAAETIVRFACDVSPAEIRKPAEL